MVIWYDFAPVENTASPFCKSMNIMPASLSDYRIHLDLFEGPLDLLLYLVRRSEVDVVEIPIARITSQFVEFIEVLEFIDLDLIGDFLVMASTLIEIKSRLVLPQAEDEIPDDLPTDGPHGELIQKLLEYKKYKDAAQMLEDRAAEWQERFPRLSAERPQTGKNPAIDHIKEVELWDLVSALGRVLRHKTVESEGRIKYSDTPISVHMERIARTVRDEGRSTFSSFFRELVTRNQIVGVFLGILELIRHHHFRAEQPVLDGEIWIMPPLPENDRGDGPAFTSSALLEEMQRQLDDND